MSIAFQAIVLFILAFPGIVFREWFSLPGRLRTKRSITDALLQSIGAAIAIHVVCGSIVNSIGRLAHVRIDLAAVVMFASGHYGQDDKHFDKAVQSITQYPLHVISYFAICCGVAILAGKVGREVLVRYGKQKYITLWDQNAATVRHEEWKKIVNLAPKKDALEIPLIGTVVAAGGTPYLFSGILTDIYPDDDGDPEWFEVVSASRRILADDAAPHYDIPGRKLLLHASEMTTLNIQMMNWTMKMTDSELQALLKSLAVE